MTVLAVLVPTVMAGGIPAAAAAGPAGGLRAGPAAAGVMSTAAGGSGGPAQGTRVILASACGVSYAGGRVYVADGSTVRQLNPRTGWLATPAGFAASGDDSIRVVAGKTGTFYGQAMTAGDIYTIVTGLNFPEGVALDTFGNVLIGDPYIPVIQVLAEATGTFYGVAMTAGHLYVVAGTGTAGYSGDGGPATAAELYDPVVAAPTAAGGLVISDQLCQEIRQVSG